MKKQEKLKQIKKEAISVFIAMIVIIVFWTIAGLGVSTLHITIFHTPLWVITGCLGTWIFSIILVCFMMKHIFKDFDLNDTKEDEQSNE